jgi:hypothetical protein
MQKLKDEHEHKGIHYAHICSHVFICFKEWEDNINMDVDETDSRSCPMMGGLWYNQPSSFRFCCHGDI